MWQHAVAGQVAEGACDVAEGVSNVAEGACDMVHLMCFLVLLAYATIYSHITLEITLILK